MNKEFSGCFYRFLTLLLALLLVSLPARGGLFGQQDQGDGPLPVDQAYRFSATEVSPGVYSLNWAVEEGYYLYRDKIKLKPDEGFEVVQSRFTEGKDKDDPLFGQVKVYYNQALVDVSLRSLSAEPADGLLEVEYQGCWEGGICFPPVTKKVELRQVPPQAGMLPSAPAASGSGQGGGGLSLTDQRQYIAALASGDLLLTLGLFFVAGLALSLTPCVFPMIPILAGVIAGQKNPSSRRALGLSLVYVLAMAITYTGAGVAAGLFGDNLQAAFQTPWVIVLFSLLFVLFAGAMFGFYHIEMPHSLQNSLNRISRSQRGGEVAGVAVMGFLSALIVGPCVAAPLAGALIFIGQTGDPLLGGAALFVLSLGMGLPLLLVGTSAAKLLPKAGSWMNTVKSIFGVTMLLMAVWMLDRIVPTVVTMLLLGVILVVCAIYLRALDSLPEQAGGWHRFGKGVGLLLLIYGGALLLGAAGGNQSVVYPLRGFVADGAVRSSAGGSNVPQFTKVTAYPPLKALLEDARQAKQPVMLDFYADWCVSCKELEFYTFADPEVQAQMGRFKLVKVDVTANDQAAKDLYRRYGIIGPPALVFYDSGGERKDDKMLIGVPTPEEFVDHLKRIEG